MYRHGAVSALLATSLLAAGCGGGGSSFTNAKALSEKLTKGGYTCKFEDAPNLLGSSGKQWGITDAGACLADDGTNIRAGLVIFKNHKSIIDLNKKHPKSLSTGGTYLIGDNWVVSVVKSSDADKIHGIVGGEVQ